MVKQISHLMRLVNEQLKYSRSISIPKIRRNFELGGSNTVINNGDENNQFKYNLDTFRRLDSDRGYESHGVNFVSPELGPSALEQSKMINTK